MESENANTATPNNPEYDQRDVHHAQPTSQSTAQTTYASAPPPESHGASTQASDDTVFNTNTLDREHAYNLAKIQVDQLRAQVDHLASQYQGVLVHATSLGTQLHNGAQREAWLADQLRFNANVVWVLESRIHDKDVQLQYNDQEIEGLRYDLDHARWEIENLRQGQGSEEGSQHSDREIAALRYDLEQARREIDVLRQGRSSMEGSDRE